MGLKDEGLPGAEPATSATHSRAKIVVASLLILVTYLIFRTSLQPGAIVSSARSWAGPHFTPPSNGTMAQEDHCNLHDPAEEPLPAVRTEFTGLATLVYGWPSTGGVWVHDRCYGVELDFLSLDRFNASTTQRATDPAAEDAFCKRMEYIGARFWASEYDYNKQVLRRQHNSTLWAGWPAAVPEGGVWALWTEDYQGAELGVSRIRNAVTMQERCKAIEMLGGRFFADWNDALRSKPADSDDAPNEL